MTVQAIVDKADRQLEQEIAFEGSQDALDIHAVVYETINDGLANLVVVLGLGHHILWGIAKEFAATTAGAIFAVGDF